MSKMSYANRIKNKVSFDSIYSLAISSTFSDLKLNNIYSKKH